jgi:predicted lipase
MEKSVFVLLLLVVVSVGASYSATQAQQCLNMSYAAYCTESAISDWSCTYCNIAGITVSSTVTSSDYDIFGYIGYVGNTAYVVFRGTEVDNIENWCTDIDAIQITYPLGDGEVHQGFYNAWLSIKSQVQIGIDEILPGITNVIFTGHSLGAALAAFAVLEVGTGLNFDYGVSISVYTFGEPRVGNQQFAGYWDSQISASYRIVNNNDIVPHLPFISLGFWHTTMEYWYTGDGYKVCTASPLGEDPNCMDSLSYVWDWSIADHLDYFGIPLASC